jgi:hypothetical protein
MGDTRHYQLILTSEIEAGEHPVRVEAVYSIEAKGWLWDFAFGNKRVLAAAPVMAVVGTDIKGVAGKLTKMHGVKVPLPRHIERVIEPGDELRMLPVKKLLYSRECTLEVSGEKAGPPGAELQIATLTTTS